MITVFPLQNGFIIIAQDTKHRKDPLLMITRYSKSIILPLYHTYDTSEFCNVFNIFITDLCNWNRISYQLDYITQVRQ